MAISEIRWAESRTDLALLIQNGPTWAKLALKKLGPIWLLGPIRLFPFYSVTKDSVDNSFDRSLNYLLSNFIAEQIATAVMYPSTTPTEHGSPVLCVSGVSCPRISQNVKTVKPFGVRISRNMFLVLLKDKTF